MTATTPDAASHPALALLRDVAAQIRAREAAAQAALDNNYDTAAHAAALDEKCAVLIDLPDRITPLLTDMPRHLAEMIQDQVRNMALRARQARKVNSVFYKASLLYPDDYAPGQPNELELFIEQLG
ncbi:hypothetical protein [Megalodesulfovibrio gigas]|uniref:hypothetical protein n=1 Tax=Megalodesulfovibrio gigas TaxID=879 RepID=UPI0003FC7413|nr:hypothetical protein [Megalodesulfovibrio gigas]